MFNSTTSNNATLIYTNSWNYMVYMFEVQDSGTMRNSYGILIESPNGEVSDITYLKKSQILKSKSAFDFIFDFKGDFDKTDIDGVKAAFMQHLGKAKGVDFSTKSPIEQVYQELCQYVHDHEGERVVSMSDGYCNIDTKEFENIINKFDFGYKRLEILRMFKLIGILRTNKDRPYDWMLTDKEGTQYRVNSFKDLLLEIPDDLGKPFDDGEGNNQ